MLALVTLVNAVNLTDVCDGVVSGLAAVAFWWIGATVAAPSGVLLIASAAAAGGCVGFLFHNAPRARVFLGDAGSHWVGYTLSALLLLAPPEDSAVRRTGLGTLIAGVFLFELVLLIASRLRRGVPVWRGSNDHFTLRLQAAGLSIWQTVLSAWTAGLAFGGIGYALHRAEVSALVSALAAVALVVAPALMVARLRAAGHEATAGGSSEPRRVI
jgi:UDP-GlcNAc:undecaprenyl-phosphate GlcNAc-1-phosphate transferase